MCLSSKNSNKRKKKGRIGAMEITSGTDHLETSLKDMLALLDILRGNPRRRSSLRSNNPPPIPDNGINNTSPIGYGRFSSMNY